jgi:predicted nucleotidyltransferase
MELQERFRQALDKFVDEHKANKNVIGIFLTGSFIHSKPDKNSDLDVYILTKKSNFRERGNTWINGIEIEYFINPVKQVEKYFKDEGNGAPHTAHMFTNSKILYSKGNELNRLIKKAEKIMRTPRKIISKVSKENAKYQIDDMEKDLEDVYLKKDSFSFNQIAMDILNESLEIFFKVKRLNFEKAKRLENYLKQNDTKFAELYKNALLEKDLDKRYSNFISLIRYIEGLLNGKRTKEWKLKGKCTYIKQ